MLKRLLILLSLSGWSLYSNATAKFMVVEQNSGEKYSFLLAEKPIVTYVDGELVVNGDASTSYSIASVKNFHFSEKLETTDLVSTLMEMLRIFSKEEGILQIENAHATDVVTLVDMNGLVYASTVVSTEGTALIQLPNKKGVYVLSVGTKSFKIIRK